MSSERQFFEDVQTRLENANPCEMATGSDLLNILERIAMEHFDLIFLDADLLKERTTQYLHVLQALQRKCRIILMMSTDMIQVCANAYALGVDSYLIKPVSQADACQMILAMQNG